MCRTAYGESQQHDDDIVQGCTSGLGQAGGFAALLQQVAKEQHTQQGQTRGYDEGGQQKSDDGEEDALCLADLTGGLHLDEALLLGGEQTHQWGLDEGHECHIGIGTDGNGSHEVGRQLA